MKKKLHLFFILLTINCFAQFSKTHYIPPLVAAQALAEDHYLYISTPSLVNVNFKIIANGGNVISGTVNSTNPYRYTIGTGDNTQLFTPATITGIIANKGYVIEAEDLIYVSVRVNSGLGNGSYNHAGGLVSKGNSALGTTFRLGAMLNPLLDPTLLNFASILATENGTKIIISNLQNGTRLLNRPSVTGPITVTLNKNESYVLALQNYFDDGLVSNSSKIIGALVQSDKPVVVNSGSFGGSNSKEVRIQNGVSLPVGRDVGFDQIVPLEKTGKEYIFVRGIGTNELERVLLVAHSDQTQIFLNGDTTAPIATLNSGEYLVLDGSQYINSNMYITASQNLFAYQSIGGSISPANQNLFFVPPINCSTPNTVDNIPQIQAIGNTTLMGVLNIVTESGASVFLNNIPITDSPTTITGNPNFVRYTINNLSGNIAVRSTKQVYVSYFGTNGAATYGGYYSGFDLKPEIVSSKISLTTSSCIPNVSLKINTLSSYDTFQWYKNDILIPSEIYNNYKPTQPGFYQVKGSISGCVSDVFSDKIPVSECPTNNDNDLANDNIDVDYDNDGILNCTESYGSKNIDSSNPSLGVVTVGTYTNSFTGSFNNTTPEAPVPFKGNSDGSFVTEVMAGKGFSVAYKLDFIKPINLSLEYVSTANTTDLFNTDSEYIINSDIDKTITVLNPTNQLLIDTNYDGIYESGVTQFSSFEIRFRLNGNTPLAAGSGTFSFQSYQTKSIKITHKNLLDNIGNKTTFKLTATCIPTDSDSDGIPDQLDLDSDNDGIPDSTENQKTPKALSNTDINLNGLDEIFEPVSNPIDTDNDGIANYLDLDSDNDGIYDLVESGSIKALDTDKNGILDATAFGTNGLADYLETSPNSGILGYIVADTDDDNIKNYTETDSDNDLCNDVIEAGFLDANGDGILGSVIPPTVNANGKITSGVGYTIPNNNYILSAPIVITSQPQATPTCELQSAKIKLTDNGGNTYQWQLSTDGVNWNSLANNAIYSDVTTSTLTISKVTNTMSSYKYRVQLKKIGNSCGLTSAETSLTIYALPVVKHVTVIQCDDDTDGISNFNITEKNSFISANYANETFSYYTTFTGADTKDANTRIANPIAFTSANNIIWTRVENSNGCFSIAKLNLIVSTTQISSSFKKIIETCDDFIDTANDDKDGIAAFDFSAVATDIKNLLPSPSSNYTIKFYANEADALAETNIIQNPSNYRNTTANQQEIWIRVESNLDNACFGLGPYITLLVNPKPNINTNANKDENQLVCSNLPSFFITLNAGIEDNTPISNYNYIWSKDGITIPNENNYTLDVNEEGTYTVMVSTKKGCDKTRTITVTSSDIAHLNSVSISDLSDSNSMTANVSGQGNYEYSIDLPNGPFQESNYFDNISPGIHDLYISDKNGCGIIKKTIAVLGIPKFFTPNNDGYNDYWNIKGANETFNTGAQIFIYDRFGKLIKQVASSGNGWDGTYTGNPMPADDYWYTIKLEDGREAKGHFSLKR
ncbi:gliding motility-associated-like protein [Flavobacterium sp. 1]|uniref:T9SS type B sorting domain-containing protein n=1 Tax=Flavobacterium sp. 1 TaxID=2035200 RepID=UPI000C230C41|nr:T9SS type B sorting domain-containing protein [Flavobacterium sp. 1]PJJ07163.1 gliding motility-associated-like protein [Flavobacterium sp. 1]